MKPKRKDDRPQLKFIRLLLLIDSMAAMSLPHSVEDLFDRMRDHYRCRRTLRRDLSLLEAIGAVYPAGQRLVNKSPTTLYMINLGRTERLQAVAMSVVDGGQQ